MNPLQQPLPHPPRRGPDPLRRVRVRMRARGRRPPHGEHGLLQVSGEKKANTLRNWILINV